MRSYDSMPVRMDIRGLRNDFKWGIAEGCLCMLVLRVETRTHSDDKPDINKVFPPDLLLSLTNN